MSSFLVGKTFCLLVALVSVLYTRKRAFTASDSCAIGTGTSTGVWFGLTTPRLVSLPASQLAFQPASQPSSQPAFHPTWLAFQPASQPAFQPASLPPSLASLPANQQFNLCNCSRVRTRPATHLSSQASSCLQAPGPPHFLNTLPHYPSTSLYHSTTLPHSTTLYHTLPHSTTLYHGVTYSNRLVHTLTKNTLHHTLLASTRL